MRALVLTALLVLATLSLSPALEADSQWRSCTGVPTPEKFIQPGKTIVRAAVRETLTGKECLAIPGNECNLGFILYQDVGQPDGSSRRVYWATTAGHCFPVGTIASIDNMPVPAMDFVYGVWGEVAKTIPNKSPWWNHHDIALIRIYDAFQGNVAAALPIYGGPLGLSDGLREDAFVPHVGRLLGVVGTTETIPRVGKAIDSNDSTWRCICLAYNGDSGSPFLDEHGNAVGLAWMGYPQQNVSENLNRIPAPEEALQCEHNPLLICSPDPDHPVYQTGLRFDHELAAIRATTHDVRGAPVNWGNMQLATAPLTAVGRALMG